MLLYQYVLREADRLGLDTDRQAALAWLAREVSRGAVVVEDDDGGKLRMPTFPWGDAEWRSWQAALWAVRALAAAVRDGTDFDSAALAHATAFIGETRNAVWAERPGDILDGRGIRVLLRSPTRGGVTADIVDPSTLLQAVFLSILSPGSTWQRHVCHWCGVRVGTDKKPSRAKLCSACRVKKWRQEHPDENRERLREAQKTWRDKQKSPKPKKRK